MPNRVQEYYVTMDDGVKLYTFSVLPEKEEKVPIIISRSPYFAVGYACNDLVLIVLWVLAAVEDFSYLPMVMCFAVFFFNDMYGFVCWKKMEKRQKKLS